MQTGLEELRARLRADKKHGRALLLVSAALFLALCVLALCVHNETFVDYSHTLYTYTPLQVLKNLYLTAKYEILFWSGHLSDDAWEEMTGMIGWAGFVTEATAQELLLTILSGAVLSLSGAVYQSAMRNPMAVPTMLGVNSGVNLAQALMIVTFGAEVLNRMPQYYAAGYLTTAAVLALILLCGKLAGGKHMSVVDMLLAGTVINRLMNTLVNYLRDSMTETDLLVYESISEKAYSTLSALKSIGIMAGLCVLILIPVFSMRFSFNAISFEDDDVRCLGVRPNAMRLYALIAGAILTTSAMIHYGNIGMLALMVPHLCRYVFGADFRKVLATSAFYGAFLLTVGWYISSFTWIGYYQIPVGSILSVIALPILLWFNVRQKRGWE